jgi:amidase
VEHPLARAASDVKGAVLQAGERLAAAGVIVQQHSDLLPDLAAQHGQYMRMLMTALSKGAPSPNGKTTTLPQWFALADDQFRCIQAWRRVFDAFDAVIAPVAGITAFAHDDTPSASRTLVIDGEEAPFASQFAYAGLATFPNLPATSAPITVDAQGLPIGLQVICDLYQDHKAIEIARAAHALMRS